MPVNWEGSRTPNARAQGCRYHDCHEVTAAHVAIFVRNKGQHHRLGPGLMLASMQRSFCKEHTELVYSLLEVVMQGAENGSSQDHAATTA